MKTNYACLLAVLALGTLPAGAAGKWDLSKIDTSKLPAPASQTGLTYAKDIRPIFEASCFRCHNQNRARGDLRLDSLAAVIKGGKDGKMVVPGDGQKSLLVVAAA